MRGHNGDMITELIVDVLPMALGIALSPFPVIPAIMLLLTPRPVPVSSAFVAGWLVGVGLATSAFVALASVLDRADDQPGWVAWVRVGIGLALVALGVRQWLTRHARTKTPAWMASLESPSVGSAAKLALLLSVANPKILLLAGAAGVTIGSDEPGVSVAAVVVVVFTLLASVSVALPLASYLVAGERVLGPLRKARDWLQTNNSAVMAVVITVIGVLVLVKGVRGL